MRTRRDALRRLGGVEALQRLRCRAAACTGLLRQVPIAVPDHLMQLARWSRRRVVGLAHDVVLSDLSMLAMPASSDEAAVDGFGRSRDVEGVQSRFAPAWLHELWPRCTQLALLSTTCSGALQVEGISRSRPRQGDLQVGTAEHAAKDPRSMAPEVRIAPQVSSRGTGSGRSSDLDESRRA